MNIKSGFSSTDKMTELRRLNDLVNKYEAKIESLLNAGDNLYWYLVRADSTLSPKKALAKWRDERAGRDEYE